MDWGGTGVALERVRGENPPFSEPRVSGRRRRRPVPVRRLRSPQGPMLAVEASASRRGRSPASEAGSPTPPCRTLAVPCRRGRSSSRGPSPAVESNLRHRTEPQWWGSRGDHERRHVSRSAARAGRRNRPPAATTLPLLLFPSRPAPPETQSRSCAPRPAPDHGPAREAASATEVNSPEPVNVDDDMCATGSWPCRATRGA